MNRIAILILFILFISSCKKEKTLDEIRDAYSQELINEISTDSLESYILWMQDMGTRFCLADNRREVASAIRDKFRSFGYSQARLDSFRVIRSYRDVNYDIWQYNVIARLEGSLYPDSLSVVGAHYDSILGGSESDPFSQAPGAHDNASGVAAALEIARVMRDDQFEPESSIEFIAFGAEELGLYGSLDYAEKARNNNSNIKMMLNNDMIAYATTGNKQSWRLNIMDYNNSLNLLNEAEILASRYTVFTTYNDNTLNKYSDSYSFSVYGFPALFFFKDDNDPNYHTLNDLAENCNFEYCREVANLCMALLVHKNIYKN